MVVEDEQRNDKRALSRKRHIVLLAQNQKGLENIYEMVLSLILATISIVNHVSTGNSLEALRGVIVATACLGGIAAGSRRRRRG